jgi:hypothetical protein
MTDDPVTKWANAVSAYGQERHMSLVSANDMIAIFARIEALTAERDEAFVSGFSAGQKALRDLGELVIIDSPELATLRADNARLTAELTKTAARLEWCAGIIHSDKGRDQGFAWADETRAALTGKEPSHE